MFRICGLATFSDADAEEAEETGEGIFPVYRLGAGGWGLEARE
jgi:hypothetical protein